MINACKRSLRIVTVVAGVLIAASLVLPAAPDDARAGGWLDVAERTDRVKNILEKRWGEMFDGLDKATSAAMKGDEKGFERASGGVTRSAMMIAVDYFDVTDGRIEKFVNKATSAADKIERFVRAAPEAVAQAKAKVGAAIERVSSGGQTTWESLKPASRTAGQNVVPDAGTGMFVDARAALDIDPDEREYYDSETGILDERPLPTPTRLRAAAAPAPAGQASGWGDTNAVSSNAAPAAQTGWDRGDAGSFDEWVTREQEANPDCWGVVDDNSDCGAQPAIQESADVEVDDEGRSDYEAALADTLGDEPVATDDDDYLGALSALEAKEEERKRQARLAEQRRLEQERREREAELAEQRRLEQEERERQARLAEQRRREAEAARSYSSSSGSSQRTYDPEPSGWQGTAEILRQGLEALQQGYQRAYGGNDTRSSGSGERTTGFCMDHLPGCPKTR